ncbi:DUF4301 family protein [Candidatus Binatia bacterium]|nr:DUF4301 family protein [Candidatus Binatia bacterium]
MAEELLREDDQQQIRARGVGEDDVRRQLAILRNPPPYTRLLRACAAGDGIRVLDEAEVATALAAHESAAAAGRFTCFVPASGAATRMFRALLSMLEREPQLDAVRLEQLVAGGDKDAREVQEVWISLARFAFVPALREVLARHGHDLDAAVRAGDVATVLDALLHEHGLDYASLPKGLLAFHRAAEGPRTACEEHLVDAASYARAADGAVRLHLTVSPQHLAGFRTLLARVQPEHERRLGARFTIAFSHQEPATDTVAVDLDGNPFRDADGRLLFRPGGHGALLDNLGRCGADLAYVKNIDNVVPDHLKGPVVHWKKVLGGLLAMLQAKIFAALRRLDESPDAAAVDAALALLRDELGIAPADGTAADLASRRDFARARLDRPLRVCGMVPCEGDPGGGPFWVRGRNGEASPQIVETAQIDATDPEQQAMLAGSTFFNPVDLACGLRNHRGEPFDLARHVDPEAVFISEKSSGGRKLRALERPGLWNGSMADWSTVFVAVPTATFNPVKTINDLLEPQHQPPTG